MAKKAVKAKKAQTETPKEAVVVKPELTVGSGVRRLGGKLVTG